MIPEIVFLDEYTMCGRDISRLRELGNYTGYASTEPSQIIERCQTAQIVICNKTVMDADTLRHLPQLRLVCIAATGMNNIDLHTAAELGIEVRNAVGYSTYSVAEATLSSALALYREVAYYTDYFHNGSYAASERIFNFDRPTRQLRGKRWGIIGLGNIGREVARLAEAFGCEVRYHSTSGKARQEQYEQLPLDELLAWADVVSIHAPLNDRTRAMIGTRELGLMQPSAILINVARGGIVDEAALAEALNNKTIAGAAFDVFTSEPLRTSPLYALRDRYALLASPHNAWSTVEAIDRLIGCVAENIRTFQNR